MLRSVVVVVVVVVAIVVLTISGVALADPADLHGVDAEGQGRATPIALGDGPLGMVTGNPALAIRARESRTFGFAFASDTVQVRLAPRPAGVDVPASIYASRPANGGPAPHVLATSDLPNQRRDTNGFAGEALVLVGLTTHVRPWLALAVTAALGLGGQIGETTAYADEREARFSNQVRPTLLAQQRGGQILAVGAAVKATSWLDVGLSLQATIGGNATTELYVSDVSQPASSETNLKVKTSLSLTPVMGVVARPWGGLELGASVRPRHAQTTSASATVQLWAPASDPLARSSDEQIFVFDDQPLRVAFAAGWRWRHAAIATEAVWKDYRDHRGAHDETPVTPFRATLELGASGEVATDAGRLFAGARWVPSPVPDESGRENYADADRVIMGAGVSWQVAPTLSIDVGAQGQALLRRTTVKDSSEIVDEMPDSIDLAGMPIAASHGLQTNNPGFPGYAVSGWLWSATITLTYTR